MVKFSDAVFVSRVTDKLGYFKFTEDVKSFPSNIRHSTSEYYPWKEAVFLAYGGMESFDVSRLHYSPLMEMVFNIVDNHGTIPNEFIKGKSLGVGFAHSLLYHADKRRKDLTTKGLSPEESVVALVTRVLFDQAMNKRPLHEWPKGVLKELKRISKENPFPGARQVAKRVRNHWMNYVEYRYHDIFGNGEPLKSVYGVKTAMMIFPSYRNHFYSKPVWIPQDSPDIDSNSTLIKIFDTLIDVGSSFEKLLHYLILLDKEESGCGLISGALFGILYSVESVPQHWQLKDIPRRETKLKVSESSP